MAHWKENFDYKFTGAYELNPGEEKTLKIESVGREDVIGSDGKKQSCLVARFVGKDKKPMILNKTNCKTIERLYTPYVENWVGKEITVFSAEVKAFGDTVDALRIRPTIPKQKTNDIAKFEAQLRDCKTLAELKDVFMSTGFPQAQLNYLKNEIKQKLS